MAYYLYGYHYGLLEQGDPSRVPLEHVDAVARMAKESWAHDR